MLHIRFEYIHSWTNHAALDAGALTNEYLPW